MRDISGNNHQKVGDTSDYNLQRVRDTSDNNPQRMGDTSDDNPGKGGSGASDNNLQRWEFIRDKVWSISGINHRSTLIYPVHKLHTSIQYQ